MTFELRLAIIALAAFAASNLAACGVVPWLSSRWLRTTPTRRAATLLRIRLLPLGASVLTTATVVAGFLVFEPRERHETTGLVLLVLAAIAVTLPAAAASRALRLRRASVRTWRTWAKTAEPIDLEGMTAPCYAVSSDFPIVAVVGLLRPRLIVARSVLAACTSEEMRVIVSHEQSHVDRRDNVRRAILMLAPDMLGWLGSSNRLLSAWHDATEEAADDAAGRTGDRSRAVLAQALVKVARLAPTARRMADLPASALYRGDNLDRRVRRLLAPATDPSPSARPRWRPTILLISAVAGSPFALETVHALVEAAVTFLP